MSYEPQMTQEEFEGLHEVLDSARKSAKEVKVNREALQHLLSDHSALWARLGE